MTPQVSDNIYNGAYGPAWQLGVTDDQKMENC